MLPPDNLPPPPWPGRRLPARLHHRPLTWLVAGELVVMLALFAFAWHIWQSHAAPRPAPAGLPALTSSPQPDPARAALASPEPPTPRPEPRPGLATDGATWIAQFALINGDQAAWQRAEWRLVNAIAKAIGDYVDRVLVPAIRRAEEVPVNSS